MMDWSKRYELQIMTATREINGEPVTFAIVHEFSEGKSEYHAGRIIDRLPESIQWVEPSPIFGTLHEAQDFCAGLEV